MRTHIPVIQLRTPAISYHLALIPRVLILDFCFLKMFCSSCGTECVSAAQQVRR